MKKKIWLQILKEFWAPALIALAWTGCNFFTANPEQQTTGTTLIKTYGAAFFFISWLLAQYWRIQKQQKLDDKTDDIISQITGGDSYGEVELISIIDGKNRVYHSFYFSNKGKFPLYDVTVTMLDRNRLDKEGLKERGGRAIIEDLEKYETFNIGNVSVNGGIGFSSAFRFDDGQIKDFLFSIHTRNNNFSQQLKFVQSNNLVSKATKLNTVVPGSGKPQILKDYADNTFPGAHNGKINWEQ